MENEHPADGLLPQTPRHSRVPVHPDAEQEHHVPAGMVQHHADQIQPAQFVQQGVAARRGLLLHSLFILLSGFCAPFGRHMLRRGVTVFAAGALVTAVTLVFMPGNRVIFGVLTFLGTAMLLTGVLEPLLKKVMPAAGLAVSAVLFALTYHLDERWLGFGGLRLALPDAWYANYFTAFFGFLPFDFYSTDYFALLPWLFLFWAGYFLHGVVGRARMEPLRRSVCPALGWMGRHSLLLYLLHQPVIYGVLSAAAVLFA